MTVVEREESVVQLDINRVGIPESAVWNSPAQTRMPFSIRSSSTTSWCSNCRDCMLRMIVTLWREV